MRFTLTPRAIPTPAGRNNRCPVVDQRNAASPPTGHFKLVTVTPRTFPEPWVSSSHDIPESPAAIRTDSPDPNQLATLAGDFTTATRALGADTEAILTAVHKALGLSSETVNPAGPT
jgi:hypothetical protein